MTARRRYSRIIESGLFGLAIVLAGGCSATTARPAPVTPVSPLAKANDWVDFSTEYQAAVRQAFRVATDLAVEAAATREPGTWAVIADVDETILSNIAFERQLEADNAPFDLETWFAWCRRATAPAAPGALDFLHRVKDLGGRVIVITNRRPVVHDATAENLDRVGVPYDLFLSRAHGGDKGPSFRAVEEGTASPDLPPLEIVLWVGDNVKDFPGMSQDLREAPPEAFTDFGRRFVIVPNPMYGSWE